MNQPVIDVILSPAEIDLLPRRDLGGAVAVVFDVLRATSTMITALSHGAAGIRPARTIEEALELKAAMPGALLGGERHGERIEGFDLGNSPLEYGENVREREIITTTTNGTIALRAVEGAASVLAGAILNIDATAEQLMKLAPGEIVIVCAGTFRDAALEDILAAGLLISLLPDRELTDSARVALALYRQEEWDVHSAMRRAKNGRALIAKGREAEVEWCSRISALPILAEMGRDGVVRQAAPRA
ncbi:MAG TPA: 2-phosphosulfolactate phosphatase [Chthoniobacteraceae bacterium]|jgi:2-phosphosulfolactate phosphatase|nr:2-phosphosulfolactate phosphatase [Chthoniobacteraceae bacterium]